MNRPKDLQTPSTRAGASILELAICLPLLTLVALGTIEACAMLHLKQGVKIAVYEASRVGLLPTATSDNVNAQAELILDGRNIKNYSIQAIPADPRTMVRGDFFRVEISVDCAPNSLIGGWFYAGKQIAEAVEMVSE